MNTLTNTVFSKPSKIAFMAQNESKEYPIEKHGMIFVTGITS